MSLRLLSIAPVLLLAACGAEAPAPKQEDALEAPMEQPVMGPERRILAYGDSLFAGYGVDKADSYPSKLEAALRARGINARVTNAGVSGDTTAAGLQRLGFTLDAQAEKPDLFILELGGNDLLRALKPAETRSNLKAILDELKRRDIKVLIMGMRAPPNFGEFQAEFDAIYGDLAKQYDAALYPFFLEEIYQQPELFQRDRVHPTPSGIEQLVGATADVVSEALPTPE
ncbi:MAG: arylesterase [Sphingomonadaceae bacterium]|nr:arylesterase [Sphingomonadaceae bacterium]MCP5383416.1 arylesterase [Altererythrobacter sp.]MCP5392049.1 arylesterase [Sphingomonadaceae bacterium]